MLPVLTPGVAVADAQLLLKFFEIVGSPKSKESVAFLQKIIDEKTAALDLVKSCNEKMVRAAKMQDDADKAMEAANKKKAEVDKAATKLSQERVDLHSNRAAFDADQAEHKGEVKEHGDWYDQAQAEIARRAQALDERESALRLAEKNVIALKAQLDAREARLRAAIA